MDRYGSLGMLLDGGGGAGSGELPPGFRFHPTDEELISYYLLRKVLDHGFSGARAIAEIDLNKCEPWELQDKACRATAEKEWYFYSLRDRKYPTGLRTNRATSAGYWKATGKDREIRSARSGALVGMKKTLVFYRGRAPKGQKTQWVMHEFRLEGTFAYQFFSNNTTRDEWVIAKIFVKPGTVPPPRKSRYGLSSGAGDTSCFSDSTSVSMGCGGGTSASSAPRHQLQDTSSLFAVAHAAAAAAADGESSSYGATNNNSNNSAAANCRELVPCFSNHAQTDATLLGIGQYDPAPIAFEPPLAFFQSARTAPDNNNFQLPTFFSGGLQSGVSPLGMGGGAFQYWPSSGYEMKLEGAVGRAPAQMAVGPGQLDGSGWNF
ncbi:hypothetical protein QYE76_033843 [Lolium multiflorum]|uniref:NAC domain-containing protein n=1 Tax=Lolium multiflorum TaxID=4521 RepID=A0AAD8QW07_LOLMU|nr:hypothetical protein QYE76_033843 [Lolium multiflorum]